MRETKKCHLKGWWSYPCFEYPEKEVDMLLQCRWHEWARVCVFPLLVLLSMQCTGSGKCNYSPGDREIVSSRRTLLLDLFIRFFAKETGGSLYILRIRKCLSICCKREDVVADIFSDRTWNVGCTQCYNDCHRYRFRSTVITILAAFEHRTFHVLSGSTFSLLLYDLERTRTDNPWSSKRVMRESNNEQWMFSAAPRAPALFCASLLFRSSSSCHVVVRSWFGSFTCQRSFGSRTCFVLSNRYSAK